MQVTQCYTAFPPGSRVISLLNFPVPGLPESQARSEQTPGTTWG